MKRLRNNIITLTAIIMLAGTGIVSGQVNVQPAVEQKADVPQNVQLPVPQGQVKAQREGVNDQVTGEQTDQNTNQSSAAQGENESQTAQPPAVEEGDDAQTVQPPVLLRQAQHKAQRGGVSQKAQVRENQLGTANVQTGISETDNSVNQTASENVPLRNETVPEPQVVNINNELTDGPIQTAPMGSEPQSGSLFSSNPLGDTTFMIPVGLFAPVRAFDDAYGNTFQYGFGIQFGEISLWGIRPEIHFLNTTLESQSRMISPNSSIYVMQFMVGFSYYLDLPLPIGQGNEFSIVFRIKDGVSRVQYESPGISRNPEFIHTFALSTGFMFPVVRGINVGPEAGYQYIATAGDPLQAWFLNFKVEIRL